MGDRCYSRGKCRPEDRAVFEELGYGQEYEDDKTGGNDDIVEAEANYGNYDEIVVIGQSLQHVFYIFNDAGGDYGPYAFACDGTEFVHLETNRDGEPIIRIGRDGVVPEQEVAEIRQFWRVYTNAEQLIAAAVKAGV